MPITKKDIEDMRKDEHGKPYKGEPKRKRTLYMDNLSASEMKALNVKPHGPKKTKKYIKVKHSKEALQKAHKHMKEHGG